MEALTKPRTWVIVGVVAVALFLLYQFWVWEVERVEVGPDEFLVKIHLWGKDLPEGEIVAPDPSYKGVQKEILAPGRHFLNPLFYSYERVDAITVPKGKVLVLTRLAGKPIDPERQARGEFLAEGSLKDEQEGKPVERGMLRQVLTHLDGTVRINPYLYQIGDQKYEPGKKKAPPFVDAVEVKANEVGVKTLKWGKDPAELVVLLEEGKKVLKDKDREGLDAWVEAKVKEPKWKAHEHWVRETFSLANPTFYVVPAGYRGVQQKQEPSGTHYLNPHVETIAPVDISKHRVEFDDIAFPSKDGFNIRPKVTVSYQVLPEKAPELFVVLCDHGRLNQGDANDKEKEQNQILQKFVLPLIRGYVRIEGSKYDARDYLSREEVAPLPAPAVAPGAVAAAPAPAPPVVPAPPTANPLEKLQDELMKKVAPKCREMGVAIDSISVEQTAKDKDLAELNSQIEQRTNTKQQQATNKQLVQQYTTQQEEAAKKALADQKQKVVDATARLKVETTNADRMKKVAKIDLEQKLAAAQTNLDASRSEADAILLDAKAESENIQKQNEAAVADLKTAIAGFPSPEHFAQYHVIQKLSPALSEVFASDQSDFAKLFTGYMTPIKKSTSTTTSTGSTTGSTGTGGGSTESSTAARPGGR